jgi:hypothetical protein
VQNKFPSEERQKAKGKRQEVVRYV